MPLSPDVFGLGCCVGFTGFVLGCWSRCATVVLVAPVQGVLLPQMAWSGLGSEANGEPGWIRRGARAGAGACASARGSEPEPCWCRGLCKDGGYASPAALRCAGGSAPAGLEQGPTSPRVLVSPSI